MRRVYTTDTVAHITIRHTTLTIIAAHTVLPVLYLAAVIVISHDHPTDPATAPCLRPPDGHTWQGGGGGGGVSVYPVYTCTAGWPGLQSSVWTHSDTFLYFPCPLQRSYAAAGTAAKLKK